MKTWITVLLAQMILLSGVPALAGYEHGNAGDEYAAEFLFTARDVLHRLELPGSNAPAQIDLTKLGSIIDSAKVVTIDQVFVGGYERDAANFPAQGLIEVSRQRWKDYRQTDETKARITLVLHEFLGLMNTVDTNFQVSGPIIELLDIPPYSASIWLNTPGSAFAAAECTGRLADGAFVTVQVSTKGATRAPDRGKVSIEQDGNTFGYHFSSDEISQFFESDDDDAGTAMVGLAAFVQGSYPVSVKYSGKNYEDLDLETVIETGSNPNPVGSGNYLRVWMGPGHEAEEQYTVDNPVCSVDSD